MLVARGLQGQELALALAQVQEFELRQVQVPAPPPVEQVPILAAALRRIVVVVDDQDMVVEHLDGEQVVSELALAHMILDRRAAAAVPRWRPCSGSEALENRDAYT